MVGGVVGGAVSLEEPELPGLLTEVLLQPLAALELFGVVLVVRAAVDEHQVDVVDDLLKRGESRVSRSFTIAWTQDTL